VCNNFRMWRTIRVYSYDASIFIINFILINSYSIKLLNWIAHKLLFMQIYLYSNFRIFINYLYVSINCCVFLICSIYLEHDNYDVQYITYLIFDSILMYIIIYVYRVFIIVSYKICRLRFAFCIYHDDLWSLSHFYALVTVHEIRTIRHAGEALFVTIE